MTAITTTITTCCCILVVQKVLCMGQLDAGVMVVVGLVSFFVFPNPNGQSDPLAVFVVSLLFFFCFRLRTGSDSNPHSVSISKKMSVLNLNARLDSSTRASTAPTSSSRP